MIDNVVLIVTGTLHERDVHELLEKCHPLGLFDRYPLSLLFIVDINTEVKEMGSSRTFKFKAGDNHSLHFLLVTKSAFPPL
jgi:hypothetical protein